MSRSSCVTIETVCDPCSYSGAQIGFMCLFAEMLRRAGRGTLVVCAPPEQHP